MKLTRLILTIAAALLVFSCMVRAQTTNTIVTSWKGATNWCAIPYLAYDTGTKKVGGGGVILYSVTENFWAGVRAQSLNGQSTTASVQGQLQVTRTINGISVTPFAEASTGMGNSLLYSNAGMGGLISFGKWNVNSHATLELGVIGDYEHYIYGSTSGNQINGGLLVHLSF